MNLKTTNPAYGFCGTIEGGEDSAWTAALAALAKVSEATNQPQGRIAVFLGSRLGRRFADQVNAEGLDATIACWQSGKPSRTTRRQYGIADGTDYLTAEVIAAWIERGAALDFYIQ